MWNSVHVGRNYCPVSKGKKGSQDAITFYSVWLQDVNHLPEQPLFLSPCSYQLSLALPQATPWGLPFGVGTPFLCCYTHPQHTLLWEHKGSSKLFIYLKFMKKCPVALLLSIELQTSVLNHVLPLGHCHLDTNEGREAATSCHSLKPPLLKPMFLGIEVTALLAGSQSLGGPTSLCLLQLQGRKGRSQSGKGRKHLVLQHKVHKAESGNTKFQVGCR